MSYVNAHVLNQSLAHPELRDALQRSDLVYCDGYGVRLAARLIGLPVPHRMTGADWIWGVAALCQECGRSIYLLGSDPGSSTDAAAALQRWYPRLDVRGTHHGYFDPGSPHSERVLEHIAERQARHPARRDGHAAAGAVGRPQHRPDRGARRVDRRRALRLPLRPRRRARRTGSPTTASSGSSAWRSSRGGCGAATCSATRRSCTGCSRSAAPAQQMNAGRRAPVPGRRGRRWSPPPLDSRRSRSRRTPVSRAPTWCRRRFASCWRCGPRLCGRLRASAAARATRAWSRTSRCWSRSSAARRPGSRSPGSGSCGFRGTFPCR